MSDAVIVALISAIAAIAAAYITGRVKDATSRTMEERKNTEIEELRAALANLARRDKPMEHYLLFWWRSSTEWAEADWNAARQYIATFRPTCGFSRLEAACAERVTIVGAATGVDEGAEKTLHSAGCRVERLDGKLPQNTAELFSRRLRANRAFEGGQHRLGYAE